MASVRAHAHVVIALALALLAAAASCSTSGATSSGNGSADGGVSPGSDAGSDAGTNVGLDAGSHPGSDAGTNAGSDSGSNVGSDAGTGTDAAAYAVGVTTRTFTDTTRPTPANGTAPAKTSRTLVTEIWYPTSATGTSPIRNAPLASGGPFPFVLFVHGSSSGRTLYTFLTIGLAQAGYVVAAADFPLTAMSTPGGSSDLQVSDQVGDLSFLCDQLKAVSGTAGDALNGAVDGLSYAVVGHSTGGAVAELAAFAGDDAQIKHDPRVAAIVPLSGDACMFDPSFFKSRAVPVFAIGASDDLFVRFANSGKWVMDNTNAPHLLAELVGGQHIYFTDFTLLPDSALNPIPTGPTSDLAVTLRAYGDAGACVPIPAAGTDPMLPAATEHTLAIQLVRAYLDAEMRHDSTQLNGILGANNPDVVITQ
jgi:pimeloyl-ACP methyl ester carboxylesterase